MWHVFLVYVEIDADIFLRVIARCEALINVRLVLPETILEEFHGGGERCQQASRVRGQDVHRRTMLFIAPWVVFDVHDYRALCFPITGT